VLLRIAGPGLRPCGCRIVIIISDGLELFRNVTAPWLGGDFVVTMADSEICPEDLPVDYSVQLGLPGGDVPGL